MTDLPPIPEVEPTENPWKSECFCMGVMVLIWAITFWAMPDGPGSHPTGRAAQSVSSADAVSIPIAKGEI
jgi:hypothetical protein